MLTSLSSFAFALAFVTDASSSAQQQTDPSVERIRTALLAAQSSTVLTQPTIKSWGGLTLVPPDQIQGQVVQVKVPIGDLVIKATRSIAVARRERAERKAHEEVTNDLRDFLQHRQQP